MQHLGQLVKEWRSLTKSLRKHQQQNQGDADSSEPKPVIEPEWRFGTIAQNGFSAGINQADFQAIAKKLMLMYQNTAAAAGAAAAGAAPAAGAAASSDSKYGAAAAASVESQFGRSPLGRIVKVQEWHLEDVTYEGGFRMRHGKLVSSLPAAGAAATSMTEFIQKQRVAWTDMRVLQRKYDARFSLKCERGIPQSSIANLTPDQRRMQTRRSFWIENYLRIDLSIVQQQKLNHHQSNSVTPSVRWEVEIEIIPEGADKMADQQLVGHLWNWALEILDSLGKIKGSETVDGPLLVVRLKPDSNTNTNPQATTTAAPQTTTPTRAICTDVLLVPTARDICRNNN